ARPQMGDQHGRLRIVRRHVQQLRDRAERGLCRTGGHLRAGVPTTARIAHIRGPAAPEEGQGRGVRRTRRAPAYGGRLVTLMARVPFTMPKPADLLQLRADALGRLAELGGSVHVFKGMISVTLPKEQVISALRAVRDMGYEMLTDVHGMDYLTYPGHKGKRFSVVYDVHDLSGAERLFLRVDLDDGESVTTCTGIWPGASFLERECFDMIGVVFDGHPDLRKILTPEDLDGHPHRKDYPLGETPTLFNDGRSLDPPSFRAGLTGRDPGLTGWKGGTREGVSATQVPGPRSRLTSNLDAGEASEN